MASTAAKFAILSVVLAACTSAQSQPTFEVASVKRSLSDKSAGDAVSSLDGCPGDPNPGRVTFINVWLNVILMRAFDVQSFQLSYPNWLQNERYDIRAKLAPTTTKEQCNIMLQSLLTERFGMKFHHEMQELVGYELVVARSGVKMKESRPAVADLTTKEDPAGKRGAPTQLDKDGIIELAPGRKGYMMVALGSGRMRMTARLQSIADIRRVLQGMTGHAVSDKTGLTGTYDFNLDFSIDGPQAVDPLSGASLTDIKDDSTSPFLVAIQSLGLRLQPAKVPADVVVIDHIEKIPTEN